MRGMRVTVEVGCDWLGEIFYGVGCYGVYRTQKVERKHHALLSLPSISQMRWPFLIPFKRQIIPG